MTFGALIRTARLAARLSHRDVAVRAGISPTTLLYIERGQTQDPRLSLMAALCQAVGLPWARVAEVDEHPKPLRVRRAATQEPRHDA